MEKKNCKNHFQVDYRSNLKLQNNKTSRESSSVFKTLEKLGRVLPTSYTNTQGARQEDCYEFKASLSYITTIRPARALH